MSKLFPPHIGGVESHVATLMREITRQRQDYTIKIFVGQDHRSGEVHEHVDRLWVHRCATNAFVASTPITRGLRRALRDFQPDAVHFHCPFPVGDLAVLALPTSIPIIVTYHMDVVRRRVLGIMYRPVLTKLMTRASQIISFSRELVLSSPVLRRYAEKVTVVPCGIDLGQWDPLDKNCSLVRAFRNTMPQQRPVILFVGRLAYYKGVAVLLRAMKDVPATLAIVGDGSLRAHLEADAVRHGVKERVRFFGTLSHIDLKACYAMADIFVLPSDQRAEAFGLVLLEAASAGLPLVTTSLPTGVQFINQHNETGLCVPPGDAQALAGALKYLVEQTHVRRMMGIKARARVEQLFDITECARDTLGVYDRAMCRSPLRRRIR